MAFQRKNLTALGIEDDKAEIIMQSHLEVVDALKNERDNYKAEAEKIKGVQKELDDLKAKIEKDYVPKTEYDKTKQEYDDYKNGITEKELQATKAKAVKEYFESKGIKGDNLDIALMGIEGRMKDFEMSEGKLKDTTALDELVGGKFKRLVETQETKGASTPNPPAKTGGEVKQPSKAAQIAAQYHAKLYGGGNEGTAQNTAQGGN